MHFISGSFDNSVLVTGVPHLMHSYITSPSDCELSIIELVTYPNLSVITSIPIWLEVDRRVD